ncbi:hypothetical protein KC19_3G111400 [Ceratodon purpureus]|uniref:CASP-like protein n=1 Tax=Ceratodon purpureus TaxID=3225 RepID=A0A8T0IJS6_CERPU|nr:hypothetical protein KC19_3G110800 [Ceratodon purpureus]KAG0583126.1 hypothetical protein KC19_3G111400 [Ceratodon purpureus]
MATGGAWQSETFDNGRDFQKARGEPHYAKQAPPMGFDTPPAMYNESPVGMSKDSSAFGVIALSLRVLQIVFTLIAFSVMAANKQTIYSSYYSYYYDDSYYTTSTIKFSSVRSFVGVLALNCIVCFYAIVQLVQSFVNMSSKGSFISSATTGFAMLTFLFDTILAYALVAVAAAGADSAALLVDGGYSSYDKFNQRAQASVAMTFFAFILLAVSAALYPVRLLRLAKAS